MKNIALDGPAGAGKSTLAKKSCQSAGLSICGYRCDLSHDSLSLSDVRHRARDKDNIHKFLGDANIEVKYEAGVQHMILNGTDVTDALRTPELSSFASTVSANPEVRKYLLQMQRQIAKHNDCVMDGRDIGTVVLPRRI